MFELTVPDLYMYWNFHQSDKIVTTGLHITYGNMCGTVAVSSPIDILYLIGNDYRDLYIYCERTQLGAKNPDFSDEIKETNVLMI